MKYLILALFFIGCSSKPFSKCNQYTSYEKQRCERAYHLNRYRTPHEYRR